MKKNIAQLIPLALSALEADRAFSDVVKRETVGYIAAFGPTVLRMGLLPTLAVYQLNSETPERKKVLAGLRHMLLDERSGYPHVEALEESADLFDFANQLTDHALDELHRYLLPASVSLKIAVRSLAIR